MTSPLPPAPLRRRGLRENLRAPLHRNALALVTSAGLTAGLGLVYWAVAARRYTPAEVGTQSALVSAMLLVGGISQIGADSLLIRFLPVSGREGRRLTARLYALATCTALIAAALFTLGTGIWTPALRFVRNDGWWFAAFAVSTVAACLYAVQDAVLTGLRRAPWVPVENGLVSLTKIALLLIFASFARSSGIFASWNVSVVTAVVVVTALVFTRLLPRRTGPPGRMPARATLARYMFGNYIGSLFALTTVNAMPLLVIYRLGATAAAHFFVPWSIFSGLQLFSTAISYSLIVEAAADEAQMVHLFRRAMAQALLTLAPIAAVVAIAGPWMLRVLGESYAVGGGPLLRWLAVATLPAITIPLAITRARLRNRPDIVIVVQLSWSLLVLAGSYVGLGRLGVEGVGVATFASVATLAVVFAATILRFALWPRPHAV